MFWPPRLVMIVHDLRVERVRPFHPEVERVRRRPEVERAGRHRHLEAP